MKEDLNYAVDADLIGDFNITSIESFITNIQFLQNHSDSLPVEAHCLIEDFITDLQDIKS